MQKALEWKFGEEYEGKYVIVNYITHRHFDNVYKSFEELDDAIEYMDKGELWEDYYIYLIIGGYAYSPDFG